MATYNLLRESSVHIVHDGSRYLIKTTPEVSFSQTFAEDAYEVKTLHDQTKMFRGTSITKANPANFSFAVHLTQEKDETIVKSLLTDYDTSNGEQLLKSFDLYIVNRESTFKLEGCVITQGEFNLAKGSPLILTVSGDAQKLSRVGNASFSLPGSLVSTSSTRTPTLSLLDVEVDSVDIPNLITTTLQVQNNINWTPFETLQNSLSVTSAGNAMYPTTYTLGDRVVSGNITQYITSNNSATFQSFDTSANIAVKTIVNGSTFLNANLTGCMFTKRSNVAEAYTQTIDYRLVTSPANLGTIITY
jgi:hypothetical protein|tara:strand:- start:3122 stop:4030 length:909 start_codon:yes stop_codon:yes gene_type:complete